MTDSRVCINVLILTVGWNKALAVWIQTSSNLHRLSISTMHSFKDHHTDWDTIDASSLNLFRIKLTKAWCTLAWHVWFWKGRARFAAGRDSMKEHIPVSSAVGRSNGAYFWYATVVSAPHIYMMRDAHQFYSNSNSNSHNGRSGRASCENRTASLHIRNSPNAWHFFVFNVT